MNELVSFFYFYVISPFIIKKILFVDLNFNPYMQQSYAHSGSSNAQHTHPKASTDEAYEQFMKEMEKIL